MTYTIENKWLISSLNNFLLSDDYESSFVLDTVSRSITDKYPECFYLEVWNETGRWRNNINKWIYSRSVCDNIMNK